MSGNSKLHLKIVFLVALLITTMFMAVGFDNVHHYLIRHDGQVTNVSTNRMDIKSILRAAKVQVNEHDLCTINRREKVVDVIRAHKFTVITASHETLEQYTTQATVGKALKQLGISYVADRVYPHPNTRLEENLQIHVLAEDEKIVQLKEDLPFAVEYYDDYSMLYGEEKIGRRGKPGRVEITARSYRDAAGREQLLELERQVLTEPRAQIIRRGMQQAVETPEGWKRYSKKMIAHTTAYTIHCGNGDGLTSIGLIPRVGIVAVDPKVIPYYTKMYIPGYGLAMAGDCGGAIDDNDIDLFVNSYEEAIRWGRRNVEIYILEE